MSLVLHSHEHPRLIGGDVQTSTDVACSVRLPGLSQQLPDLLGVLLGQPVGGDVSWHVSRGDRDRRTCFPLLTRDHLSDSPVAAAHAD